MKSAGWLRFKIATSFLIAGFGAIMLVRLSSVSAANLLDFVAPAIFVIAGVWRGLIFLNAARGLAKT
jgi:hypothetical protein